LVSYFNSVSASGVVVSSTLNVTLRKSPSGVQGRSPGLGDEVPEKLKNFTSKFYAFLVVIHTQYMKSKHWLLKTKTSKHNS